MSNPGFISKLSPHLFWDVDVSLLRIEKDKPLIVHRVLEYGIMHDWQLLNEELGFDEIVRVAKNLRNLDDISLNFISKLSGIPRSEFRCYLNKQLLPPHTRF
jgi:hypothetical protein